MKFLELFAAEFGAHHASGTGMGVGATLRSAREGRGLSAADVSARTKIPIRLLLAIDAEDYGRVPHGIYGRGYVRAYAQAVGLDAAAAVAAYKVEVEAQEAAEEESPAAHRPSAPPPHGNGMRPVLGTLALAASALALLVWLGRERPQKAPDVGAAPGSEASAPTEAMGQRDVESVGTSGVRPAVNRPAERTLALVLEARRPCWLALTVDGQRVAYRLLGPGERIEVHARSRVWLRTGDAGALMVSANAAEARALGPPGAVRSVEFTPDDYQSALWH